MLIIKTFVSVHVELCTAKNVLFNIKNRANYEQYYRFSFIYFFNSQLLLSLGYHMGMLPHQQVKIKDRGISIHIPSNV